MSFCISGFAQAINGRPAPITAATINAAYAIDAGSRLGSLQPGKQADFILLNIETPEQLPYYFGVNLVDKVIKKGWIIYE